MTSSKMGLIVACTTLRAGNETRIRACAQAGVNWQALLWTAIPHGVLPLVAYTLKRYAGDLVPEETLGQIGPLLGRVRRRSEQQCRDLEQVMEAFAGEGLRVLAFKGPTLGAYAYGDPGLRECHDLDLWTDRADLGRAGDLLRARGYRAVSYEDGLPTGADDLLDRQAQFQSAHGEVIFDLQDLELASNLRFCPVFSELWDRRRDVVLIGHGVPALNTEDLLLALAAHGSKHVWRRLNWLVDVVGVLEHTPDLDWAALFERAERWRCRHRLILALALAVRVYDSAVPADVLRRIESDAYAMKFVSTFVDSVLREPGTGYRRRGSSEWANGIARSLHSLQHHCRCTDHMADRVRVVGAAVCRKAGWLLTRNSTRE